MTKIYNETAPFDIALDVQKHIAIILPAYNESLTVVETLLAFHEALPAARIYVVDNNSTDDTQAKAKLAMQEHNIPGTVLFEARKGKGNAVRRAFIEVDAKAYLLADADCTYPASQAAEMLLPILQNEADMVIGDRISGGDYKSENKRPLHNFGNHLVQRLVNLVGKSNFNDIMTGYRALSAPLVRSYPLLVEGFQLETDISLFAARARLRCVEIPIRYQDRPEGSFSKLSTLYDGISVLLTIFRIMRFYRPLSFFSVIAAFFCILGLVLGIPVVLEFMQTGFIKKVPTAILAAALEIIATNLMSVGLILDASTQQHAAITENTFKMHAKARYTA